MGASGVIMLWMLLVCPFGVQEEIAIASVVTVIFRMTVIRLNLFAIFTCDQRPGLSVDIRSDHLVAFYKFSQIRLAASDTIAVERPAIVKAEIGTDIISH